MTKPRKEQIRNLKTKYTRLRLPPTPYQNICNRTTTELSISDTADFLSSSITRITGGTENNSPAVVIGGVKGPFSIISGSKIGIIINGISNTIEFVSPDDYVNWLNSSDPVVTTSHLVSLINDAFGVEVAFNFEGRVVLSTINMPVSTGTDAHIELVEVVISVPVLQIFGLKAGTVTGKNEPEHGIITCSSDSPFDLYGGTVQVSERSLTNSSASSFYGRNATYIFGPEVSSPKSCFYYSSRAQGLPLLANLKSFLNWSSSTIDPIVKISYYQKSTTLLESVSSNSNFRSINNLDQFRINIRRRGTETTISSPITNFITLPNGLPPSQKIVEQINNAFNSIDFGHGLNPSLCAVPIRSGFPISAGGSFSISFNGGPAIVLTPSASDLVSESSFQSYIMNRIAAAGQSSFGYAMIVPSDVADKTVYIVSATPNTGSILISPGTNVHTTIPDGFTLLKAVGLNSGLYKAWTFASVYGNDEIKLSFPKLTETTHVQFYASPTVLQKLGLVNELRPKEGFTPVEVGEIDLMIPEMVEFHEELDNHDTEQNEFDNLKNIKQISELFSSSNFDLSSLLNQFGELKESLIPTLIKQLNVNNLRLGKIEGDTQTSASIPKIEADVSDMKIVLLFESKKSRDVDSGSANKTTRIYLYNDSLWMTVNAVATGDARITWSRDSNADPCYAFEITKQLKVNKYSDTYPVSGLASWPLNSWGLVSSFSVFRDPSNQYGDTEPHQIEAVLSDTSSDSNASNYIPIKRDIIIGHKLIDEIIQNTGFSGSDHFNYRRYSGFGEQIISFNAKQYWDNTLSTRRWVKDFDNFPAIAVIINSQYLRILFRDDANNGDWDLQNVKPSVADGWDRESLRIDYFNKSLQFDKLYVNRITSNFTTAITEPTPLHEVYSQTASGFASYLTPTGFCLVSGALWTTYPAHAWQYRTGVTEAWRISFPSCSIQHYSGVNGWLDNAWVEDLKINSSGTHSSPRTIQLTNPDSSPADLNLVTKSWVESNWILPGIQNAILNSDFHFKNRRETADVLPNVTGSSRAWVADRWYVRNSPTNIAFNGTGTNDGLAMSDYSSASSSTEIIQEIDRDIVQEIIGKKVDVGICFSNNFSTSKSFEVDFVVGTGSVDENVSSGSYATNSYVVFGSSFIVPSGAVNQVFYTGGSIPSTSGSPTPQPITCAAIRIRYNKTSSYEDGPTININWVTLQRDGGIPIKKIACGTHEKEKELLDKYYYNTNAHINSYQGKQTITRSNGVIINSLTATTWASSHTLFQSSFSIKRMRKTSYSISLIHDLWKYPSLYVGGPDGNSISKDSISIYNINKNYFQHALKNESASSISITAGVTIMFDYEVDAEI